MAPEPDLPPGLARKVAPHLHKTTGYVLALREPCLELQWRETVGGGVPGRAFHPLADVDLRRWTPTGSWLLAVILCPGDTLAAVAAWARRIPPDQRDRVRVYHHPRVAYAKAAEPWFRGGHAALRRNRVNKWEDFHKLFGRHHAIQCYEDHVRQSDTAP